MSTGRRHTLQLLVVGLLWSHPFTARAAEPEPDAKTKAAARKDRDSTKREIGKAEDRVQEAACTAKKTECARRKSVDHVEEAKEAARDDIQEAADQVRDEKKK